MKYVKKNSPSLSKNFSFNFAATKQIKQLLQNLSAKMAVEVDAIPSKWVKLAASPLYKPLTEAINFCILCSIFPDSAKIALTTSFV